LPLGKIAISIMLSVLIMLHHHLYRRRFGARRL
jgi:hypothetical protein